LGREDLKKDISKLKFGSIVGWRGDSMVCPQAFGGDIFSGCSCGCWWCFCREMEEELFNKYYKGWSRELVRPCDPDDYKKLFDKAYGSDKPTSNWYISCLRQGLPFDMGSKAETFCQEDFSEKVVVKVLELFREYKVPIIFQTKAHYVGLTRYLDIIKDLNAAVIVAIMGGSDTLSYKLEPGVPMASSRWYLVKELNKRGIWAGVRWEPVMYGINSDKSSLEGFAEQAKRSGAKHASVYNYRTSAYKIAQREFEKRGYNYAKMLKGNLDESWRPIGKRLFGYLKQRGVPVSSPDFVNFPFDNDMESCCGTDDLFVVIISLSNMLAD
jgi:DNA repair photolyase